MESDTASRHTLLQVHIMQYVIITVRFTLRLVALSLISLGMVVSLLVVLITALVSLTESVPVMPTDALQPIPHNDDDSSVHDEMVDDMADMAISNDEPMTTDEIDELVASLPVDDTDVAFVGYQSLSWNELRALCKSMGISKGCKTRAQYEEAYVLHLTSVN